MIGRTLSSAARCSSTFMPSSGCSTVSAGAPGYKGQLAHPLWYNRGACLVDPALLPRDLRECLAKNADVVDAERGHARDDGARDDVRAVVCAADADLEDRRVDFEREKGMEGDKRHEAEVGGLCGRAGVCALCAGVSGVLKETGRALTTSFLSSRSQTSKKKRAKSSSDIGEPFMRMRSRTATRCGEV